MILGVIPARGGSKGLPGKNIALLNGKPVIAYTIESAKQAKRLERLVVSTDDPAIEQVARDYGCEVLRRPAALAADHTPMPDTILHAIETVEEREQCRVDIVVWMQANVPIRPAGMIDQVLERLINAQADSAQTVVASHFPPDRASKLNAEGILEPYFGRVPASGHNRQDHGTAYFPDGAVVAVRRAGLAVPTEKRTHIHYHWGAKALGVIQPAPEYSLEIDTPFDFYLAQLILSDRARRDAPLSVGETISLREKL